MKEITAATRRVYTGHQLWLFLFLLKLIFAGAFILPFYLISDSILSSSQYAGRIVDHWDVSTMIEMYSGKMEMIPTNLLFGMAAGLIFLVAMQFFNGGIYYLTVSGNVKPLNWNEFFVECYANFGAHLRITALMALVYLVLITGGLFFVNLLETLGGKLVGSAAIAMSGVKALILLLIVLMTSIFSDSARAANTIKPGKPFREVLKTGADFFRPHMIKMTAYFLLTYIPFILIWVLMEWLALQTVSVAGGVVGIALEFIFFQICALARTGQKLWYLHILGIRFRAVNPGRFLPEQAELRL